MYGLEKLAKSSMGQKRYNPLKDPVTLGTIGLGTTGAITGWNMVGRASGGKALRNGRLLAYSSLPILAYGGTRLYNRTIGKNNTLKRNLGIASTALGLGSLAHSYVEQEGFRRLVDQAAAVPLLGYGLYNTIRYWRGNRKNSKKV